MHTALLFLWTASLAFAETAAIPPPPDLPKNPLPPPPTISCSKEDLSSHFGSVRDQGAIGWCYAFAMADLLGEHLKIRPPDKISAFDVAAAYASPDQEGAARIHRDPGSVTWGSEQTRRQYVGIADQLGGSAPAESFALLSRFKGKGLADREGGMPQMALFLYAMKGGYCLESRLPSQSMVGDGTDPAWLTGKVKPDPKGNWIFTPMEGSKLTPAEGYIYRQIFSLEAEAHVSGLPPQPTCDRVSFGWAPKLLDPVFRDTITSLAMREVRRVINEKCGARVPYSPPAVHHTGFDPDTIRSNLAAGRSLEVSYDVHPFRNSIRREETKFEGKEEHSSVIVGMRPGPGGTCQYKIRNSWGPDCAPYDPEIAKDCKDGYFWVDESALAKVASGLTHLSN